MSNLEEVLQYREQIEQEQRQIAMAEGKLQQTMEQLRKRFYCRSLEEGKQALKDLKRKRAKAQRMADKKLTTFIQKWKDVL